MMELGALLKLTTWPQRLLLGLIGAALLSAVTYNVLQLVENRHLTKINASLDQRINDPKFGFVARLAQARTNTETLKAAVVERNKQIRQQSERDALTIAAVQQRYDTEHGQRLRAERTAAAFLAHKPAGATVTDRILDVDAQILGDLK